jgi:hypothetical protein
MNRQVGTPIILRSPPAFEGFELVGGTWRPRNTKKTQEHEDHDEEVFNITAWAPGTLADCELYQIATDAPELDILDVIPDSDGDLWAVLKADPVDFGLKGIRYSCTLRKGTDKLDLTQVEEVA